jgi:hypothetical protein
MNDEKKNKKPRRIVFPVKGELMLPLDILVGGRKPAADDYDRVWRFGANEDDWFKT